MRIRHLFTVIMALLPLIINAQNYDNLWKEFNKNIDDRLPESANKVLDNIEKHAVKQKNDIQLLKVVIKRCDIINMTHESPEDSILSYCKWYSPRLSSASQAMLNVTLAEMSNSFDIEDVLKDSTILMKTPMEKYSVLFEEVSSKYSIDCEPTLYDYVLNKTIYYCRNNNKTKEAEKYTRMLLNFDLRNNHMTAYYNNRLRQIEFNHDGSFLNDCEDIVRSCNDTSIMVKAKLMQINYLTSISTENYVEAMKICDEVITMVDKNSDYYKQCMQFKKSICKKEISVGIQNVQIPGRQIPVALAYRNTSNPTYRLIKVNSNFKLDKYKDKEEFVKLFDNEIIVENTISTLLETDYEFHSSLIALPPLNCGFYVLVFSNNDKFDDLNDLSLKWFQVSDLAYIVNENPTGFDIYATTRYSGMATENVDIHVYTEKYSYSKGYYEKFDICQMRTDKNGHAEYTNDANYVKIDLSKDGDTLVAYSNIHPYRANYNRNKTIHTEYFTDRAIYRPGQTVQFMAITYTIDSTQRQILSNYTSDIKLFDANNEMVDKITLTTDEYGSVSGSFVLPADRLNGWYSISNNNGYVDFKVENYKRPTFEIIFDNTKDVFCIGDSVHISGKVKSLAGFGLGNTKYTYTITRQTAQPKRYFYNSYYSPKTQIFSGDSVTLSNGVFNIDFKLLDDESNNSNADNIYAYTIAVRATNPQGESEESKHTIFAARNKYQLNVLFDDKEFKTINLKDLEKVEMVVQNNAGELTNTAVEYTIYKFNDFDRYDLEFENFDRQLLSDSLLVAYFPQFNYYRPSDDCIVNQEKLVNSKSYSIVFQDIININGKGLLFEEHDNLTPGRYAIAAKSCDDSLSKCFIKFDVFDKKSKEMPYKKLMWCGIDKTFAQPGDVINLHIGSSDNVSALLLIKNGDKNIKSEWISLNNNVLNYKYKVTETDRGNLVFEVMTIKYNTCHSEKFEVDIPYDNLKLNIDVCTEREVLSPGENITWKINIRNNNGKGVTSSILAGMYDASLDKFYRNNWYFNILPENKPEFNYHIDKGFNFYHTYPILNIYWFEIYHYPMLSNNTLLPSQGIYADVLYSCEEKLTLNSMMAKDNTRSGSALRMQDEGSDETPVMPAKVRSDFNETAFFYPNIKTDNKGNATISFTLPDALTQWNLRVLSYSKDLKFGNIEKTFMSQQPVMIMADMPRFCYDEDTLWIVANVMNLSDVDIKPIVKLEVFEQSNDTMKFLDCVITPPETTVVIPVGGSQSVRWKVAMRKDVNLLTFRFSASTDNFSDAEQHTIPVLNTEVFMTQSFSLIAKGNEKKNYNFNFKVKDERNHRITLNLCKNPIWYAIQALPYLNKENEKSAETAFYRYFTNSVAKHIATSLKNVPEMTQLLDSMEKDSLSSESELMKNHELKEIQLQETPWVFDAKNEIEQRANISRLFDEKTIDNNIMSALKIIEKKQKPNGGWAWIEGMPVSAYVTQYVLGGFGRLERLISVESGELRVKLDSIEEKAFHFIENDVVGRFGELKEVDKENYRCSLMIVRELFVMSYFQDLDTSAKYNEAKTFFINKLKRDWKDFNYEGQAAIALILNRNGHDAEALTILKSMHECAQKNELGMYWFETGHWPYSGSTRRSIGVEDEARILEAFNEIDPKNEETDAMRFWILGQKRTNMWDNDRATAEAIYAIVNRGTDWVNDNGEVVVTVNNDTIRDLDRIDKMDLDRINKQVDISIDNQTNHQVWGGLFRQYFVPIDKVQKSNEDMKIRREFFVERHEGDKTDYLPIAEEDIKVGDKIKIVICFENQQDMEFVYLKDLRGACFEPTEQISRYHYSNGLWYYQSTSDVAMEFFFDSLPKGKHELSHTVYVTKEGTFSAGYALIQCQYAPEFGAYSEGSRIEIR